MNNNSNRNNNNRRRGRGNRNQGGGGNSSNRIDSRARGNAPQLLDKYKKLAQDAQHNGDRVQTEYYLQFADHYFRVIADNKARQDEQRAKRDPERGQANDDSSDDDDGDDDRRNDERRSKPKAKRGGRNDKQRGRDRDSNDGNDSDDSSDDGNDDEVFEAEENPFVRKKSAQPRKPASRKRKSDGDGQEGEIDANVLPPAIAAATSDEADAKPAKPRRRSRKAADDESRKDGGDEALSAVG
ncbi:MAG: DUF4167 domain-containing protein [Erythrobacter sp.]|nr:DUF4167 domain-containing protein [Erythrobacter sp.]